jgi:hypothetical protein
MADFLDGKIYTVGTSGLEGLIYDFTQPVEKDEPSLVNAAIALRVWKLAGTVKFSTDGIPDKTRALPPASSTPSIILTVGNGLTRISNQAKHQSGSIQFTPAQLVTLLGTDTVAAFSYLWVITPVTNGPAARPLGFGYDGVFGLVKEGYTLPSAARV